MSSDTRGETIQTFIVQKQLLRALSITQGPRGLPCLGIFASPALGLRTAPHPAVTTDRFRGGRTYYPNRLTPNVSEPFGQSTTLFLCGHTVHFFKSFDFVSAVITAVGLFDTLSQNNICESNFEPGIEILGRMV